MVPAAFKFSSNQVLLDSLGSVHVPRVEHGEGVREASAGGECAEEHGGQREGFLGCITQEEIAEVALLWDGHSPW